MCIPNLRLSIFAIILLVGCSEDSTAPEYSREDCILRADVEWLIEGPEEIRQAQNSFGEALIDKLHEQEAPLAGLSISDSGEQWFFQFRENCGERAELVQRAFNGLSDSQLSDTFTYSISLEAVTPGPETISLRGEDWRD